MPPPDKSDMPTITFPYQIVIEIETAAPDVAQILLNGSTQPLTVKLPEDNAGDTVAEVTVITHSGDPWTEPLVLSGDDGAMFDLSGNSVAPCNLTVGQNSLGAGSYSIKISAPPPA